MELWAWAILLLVVGLGLAALELFVPSGGILGFLSACSVLGSVVLGFRHSPSTGFLILTVAIFGLPVVLMVALHYWPRTPIGRRVLLMAPTSQEVLPDDPRKTSLKSLVGQVGRAKSKMLPAGVVAVDGRSIDAISEGMPIDPGQAVRVVQVRANRVVVRPIEDESAVADPGDPLSQPVESVIPDPFDETTA